MLIHQGWRPNRTIILCCWDGEEYGLLGSTNFGEKHAADLYKNLSFLNVCKLFGVANLLNMLWLILMLTLQCLGHF